jgi:hypothetical protein
LWGWDAPATVPVPDRASAGAFSSGQPCHDEDTKSPFHGCGLGRADGSSASTPRLNHDGKEKTVMRTILTSRPGRVSTSLAAVAFALAAGALVIPTPAQAQAVFPGLGKCLQDCEDDRECQADCRELYMNDEDRKEHYRDQFRACWDECYNLSGTAREECNESCRDDYKTGLDLD